MGVDFCISDTFAPKNSIDFSLLRTNISYTDAKWIEFFLEMWCDQNCTGEWKIENNKISLKVILEEDIDYMAFQVSYPYDVVSYWTA